MSIPRNPKLRVHSRSLRKNMTNAEVLLWSRLRRKTIEEVIGEYIVDFCCHRAKLVIELDGGQHYSCEVKQKDSERDGYMSGLGLKVLRFSDRDVLENLDGVIDTIWGCILSRKSP